MDEVTINCKHGSQVRCQANRGSSCRHVVVAGMMIIVGMFLVVNLLALMPRSPVEDLLKVGVVNGISKETQDQIDSGEWPPDMVKDMMQKGLLPPRNFDEPSGFGSMDVSSDDDKRAAKKKRNSTATNAANSSTGSSDASGSGRQVGQHSGAPGHCQQDPHITCQSYEDCQAVSGACVWWFCSLDPDKTCVNSMDCGDSGGICTGPGYCSMFPQAACQTTEDCDAFGGKCVVGGYCIHSPNYACLDDSDCNDDDRCSSHSAAWWRTNEDFPKNDEFGPYRNWTDKQLRQKMLIAMKKIVHVQQDLQAQVPINSRFADLISRVRNNESRWEIEAPIMEQESRKQVNFSEHTSRGRIADILNPVIRAVPSMRWNISTEQTRRMAHAERLWRQYSVFERKRRGRLVHLQFGEQAILKSYNLTLESLRKSKEVEQLNHFSDTRWNQSTAHLPSDYQKLLKKYQFTATSKFDVGLAEIKRSLQPFITKTKQSLNSDDRNLITLESGSQAHVSSAVNELERLKNGSLALMDSTLVAMRAIASTNSDEMSNTTLLFQ